MRSDDRFRVPDDVFQREIADIRRELSRLSERALSETDEYAVSVPAEEGV